MSKFTPSKYQTAILDFIRNGQGSAVIEAVAGSGKTTTVMQCLDLIPTGKSVLLLAFNKSIAMELQEKAPQAVSVRTFHALGNYILGKQIGRCTIDARKLSNIIKDVIKDQDDYRDFNGIVSTLVQKARAIGLLPDGVSGTGVYADTPENWDYLITHFDIDVDSMTFPLVLGWVRQVIKRSVDMAFDNAIIDFDEMIYIPVIKQWRGFQNDFVFIDESQDVSPSRLALVANQLKPNGRVIAVGDSKQAIYGFTGADAKSMQTIRDKFKAVSMPLSISYRCAKSVVREAQKVMPTIESSETAPEGTVKLVQEMALESFKTGEMVICRKNAPLVSLAFRLIAKGIPARILGRDIAGGLVVLIKKQKARSLPELKEKLTKWQQKEIAKWKKDDREDMIEAVNDKLNCIYAVLERSGVSSVDKLISAIETMFDQSNDGEAKANNSVVTLCSIHKSKGLEANTVHFLDRDIIPLKSAKQAWQLEQENNLLYVGITRAKENLNYITSDFIK